MSWNIKQKILNLNLVVVCSVTVFAGLKTLAESPESNVEKLFRKLTGSFSPVKPKKANKTFRTICSLEYIVDGDTIVCRTSKKKVTVRLLGIDTLESRVNKRARKQAQKLNISLEEVLRRGKLATKYLKTLMKPGDTVEIGLDKPIKDKYGRVLGYVFAGKTFVNAKMLSSGHAALFMSKGLRREKELIKASK